MIKVVCGIMPYVYMADIVDKLLKMHSGALEKDMSLLTASIVKMAVFWLMPHMSCDIHNPFSCGDL